MGFSPITTEHKNQNKPKFTFFCGKNKFTFFFSAEQIPMLFDIDNII